MVVSTEGTYRVETTYYIQFSYLALETTYIHSTLLKFTSVIVNDNLTKTCVLIELITSANVSHRDNALMLRVNL